MKNYVEIAQDLRYYKGCDHNCTQAILVTFAEEMDMTPEAARKLGANFALGMGCGAACGVVTGVVAALGAMGFDKKETSVFMKKFMEKYGSYDCKTLLQSCKERGESRGEHCNQLIYYAVGEVAQVLETEKSKEESELPLEE